MSVWAFIVMLMFYRVNYSFSVGKIKILFPCLPFSNWCLTPSPTVWVPGNSSTVGNCLKPRAAKSSTVSCLTTSCSWLRWACSVSSACSGHWEPSVCFWTPLPHRASHRLPNLWAPLAPTKFSPQKRTCSIACTRRWVAVVTALWWLFDCLVNLLIRANCS